MAVEQTSGFCAGCGQHRLFTRTTEECPHTAYLVGAIAAGVLTCGIGSVVVLLGWLLHIAVLALMSQPPFLCTSCGRPWGTPAASPGTWPFVAGGRPQHGAADGMGMDAMELRRRAAYERHRLRRERRRRLAAAFAAVPERWDRLLHRVAGEGNDLVYRFLWFLTLAALLAACAAVFWGTIRSAGYL